MKRSTDRILTTHVGRLDGPAEFRETITQSMRTGAAIDRTSLAPDSSRRFTGSSAASSMPA